jgi:hypothetical protein
LLAACTRRRESVESLLLTIIERDSLSVAAPRVAVGALLLDAQVRVLLAKPTYKQYWDIPGGYV